MTLAWSPSSGAGVAGYRIYQGGLSQTYTNILDAGNASSITVGGLVCGATYYFAATAYDNVGLESSFSSELVYTVPSALPPTVAVTSPVSGASYVAPANITLAAGVTANGHTITKVQFYNGTTLLGEDTTAPYTLAWSNVSAGAYSISGRVVYETGSVVSSAAVAVTVSAPPVVPLGLTFGAESGTISSPFVVSNGFVYQPTGTDLTNGGRAVFTFIVPNSGTYEVSAIVSVGGEAENSFWVNIDGEPTDPMMIWDIPVVAGYNSQTVTWRGEGGTDPTHFSLEAGMHQLIVVGREEGAYLGMITISPTDNVPTPPVTAPPSIVLTSPTNGDGFVGPANLSLAADVVSNGHTITRVQFYSGTALLGEDTAAPYTLAWSDVSAGAYTITGRVVYDTGIVVSSDEVSVTVTAPPVVPQAMTFGADLGTISSPFVVSNGFVYQPIGTDLTNGGRAVYAFSLPSSGVYQVSAVVAASGEAANSFWVNIDEDPTDPMMIWDIPVLAGYTSQPVTWRGEGGNDPKQFSLAAGTHQLIVVGREASTYLGTITISPTNNTSPPGSSTPPSIIVSLASSGAGYVAPANLKLTANVTPNGHTINKVQFYNGSMLLGDAPISPYTLVWSNVNEGSYSVTGRVVYDGGSVVSSAAAVALTVSAPPLPIGQTFSSTSGMISSPFVASNGFLFQRTGTDLTNAGRAVYTFTLANAGVYQVSAVVSAPGESANSFWVNIDDEPTDPAMIWDIPVAAGYTNRTMTWRGEGAEVPKQFSLAAGTHRLIVLGREANTFLGAISINPTNSVSACLLNASWQMLDIGNTGIVGTEKPLANGFSISGAGALGTYSDSFAFFYQPMTGDGEITVQLTSEPGMISGARTGVMLRETLTTGSRYSFVGLAGDGTSYTQSRNSTGGIALTTARDVGPLTNTWVRLVRSSDSIYTYTSSDGVNWLLRSASQLTMAQSVYVGLVVSSGAIDQLVTATFKNPQVLP